MNLRTVRNDLTPIASNVEPAYVELHRQGKLRDRAREALTELESCRLCPRDCAVDRRADDTGICRIGRYARVASHFPHFGEEDCLRGKRGSGTIFFSSCNLRCVFCQNYDVSQVAAGREVTPAQLATMMLELQYLGCHNINLVTPEHVVPQIIEALPIAVERGLRLPIVYNTSAYDSIASLQLLDGIVDIYMPDFKIWDPVLAQRYLKARDYPETARRAIREMHRQVGVLRMDTQGLAKRGLLVRHLVMPDGIAGTAEIMRFLAEELSPDTYVNIMNQYYPANKVSVDNYSEINRHVSGTEYADALRAARRAGLWRFDTRYAGLAL